MQFGRFIVAVAALVAVVPACAQSVAFDKRLYKVNGAAVSTNPASLANGDLLDWVLTYQYNPVPAPPAQADIRDPLSPALQYVNASLQVPPSWTRQWSNGTWSTTQPSSVIGVGALTAPNVAPFGAGQSALLPAPPTAPVSTQGFGGDGYRAIPSPDGNVYVVNHHSNGRYLDCFVVATGVRCAGYPAHVPNANGLPFNTATDNGTPGKTYEYLDRTTNRLYFPAQKINATPPHEIGLLCANLTTKTSCGFHSLTLFNGTSTQSNFSTSADMRSFLGIGAVGKKVYMQLPGSRIGCLDTTPVTPVPCAGQPYANDPVTADEYDGSSEIVGTRIYSIRRSTSFILACFDTTTNAGCGTGWPKIPDPGSTRGILYPLLDNAGLGTVQGICTLTTNPASSNAAFRCYDLNGTPVGPPPNYTAWARTHSGGFYQGAGYGQSGYYKSRVFNAAPGSLNIGCFDFMTGAPCSAWPVVTGPVRHYATIADPERPGCMWYYGDDGKLGSFLAANGKPCSGVTAIDTVITPSESYCATNGTITAWGQLYLSGLTVGSGITATLTLYDGNNPNNLAKNASGIAYAQNLPVTSFPVNLAGLGIGYGSNLGQYTSLRVVLELGGITSNAPWTQTPPPSIEVTWAGGPPEICFQTRVATCETPVITNQATAVTTPFGGTAITSTAPTPVFSAAHDFGAGCPAKLTVTKNVIGAPSGFTGTFLFPVTCSTPNGLLQQQLSITWPGTTASLNVPAGSTCFVAESPNLPALPASHTWSGVPVVSPANGTVQVTPGGANMVSFRNVAQPCDDRGQITIRKRVDMAPPGFSGTFTFNVSCWTGTGVVTQQAQIAFPGQTTVTVGGIPSGSVCTVMETSPLPPLPSGWFWQTPTYNPASGQVSLIETCCREITVINRAKFCCPKKEEGIDIPIENR